MSHVRRAVACIVALTAALFTTALPLSSAAHAVPASSTTAAAAAVTWLETQQQSDGGFEVAAFPGFETLDATLAIAENGQTGATWSASEATTAVHAVQFGGSGSTPFDAIDAYAQTIPTLGALAAGTAAKDIVLGAEPYGFDPTAFDPAGDGTPVDLVSLMGGCTATGGSTFNFTLYIVLAQSLVCSAPDATAIQAVRDGQRADGGWNFLGDADPAVDSDIDTTALAIEALVAGGADATDPAVHAALGFYAARQQTDGAFQSFGSDDPNSTSTAILGITAAGYDVESPCWRDTAVPSTAGSPYVTPTAWLLTQQQSDGRIASPNDGFGVNTFATSQTVEGLLQSWLPVARAASQTCDIPLIPITPVTPVSPVVPAALAVAPRFTG
jgi:hypothetical protein